MTATTQPTSTVELSTWKQGKIVYTARNEQGAGLYLLDASTGEATLIQTGKSENYLLGASSSPDSSKIAYYQYPDQLFVIDFLAQLIRFSLEIANPQAGLMIVVRFCADLLGINLFGVMDRRYQK